MGERTFKVRLYFTGIEAKVANKKLQETEKWHDWVVAEQYSKGIALTSDGFVRAKTLDKSAGEEANSAYMRRNELIRKHSCELISPVLTMEKATDVVLVSNLLESSGATCIESYRTIAVELDKPRKWGRAKRGCLVKTLTQENRLLYTLFAYSPLRQEFCDKYDEYPGRQIQANRLATNKWFRKLMVDGLIADNTNIVSTLHYRGLLERCVFFE